MMDATRCFPLMLILTKIQLSVYQILTKIFFVLPRSTRSHKYLLILQAVTNLAGLTGLRSLRAPKRYSHIMKSDKTHVSSIHYIMS
jgi:hypothetical protein